jgi:hypothetical protein
VNSTSDSDLRDVGGRIAVADEGFQRRAALFGIHLPVAVIVEAVDHDAVEAGELAEDACRLVAQRTQRVGAEHGMQRMLHMARQIDGRSHRLELDDQAAFGRAMREDVEIGGIGPRGAADGGRYRVQVARQMRHQTMVEIAA